MASGELHPHGWSMPPQPGIPMHYNLGMDPGQQLTGHHSPQEPDTIPTVSQLVSEPVKVQPQSGDVQRRLWCWQCHNTVITQIIYIPGTFTTLMMLLVGCLTCWLLAMVPYCVNKCQDAVHTCPKCGTILYYHKRM